MGKNNEVRTLVGMALKALHWSIYYKQTSKIKLIVRFTTWTRQLSSRPLTDFIILSRLLINPETKIHPCTWSLFIARNPRSLATGGHTSRNACILYGCIMCHAWNACFPPRPL